MPESRAAQQDLMIPVANADNLCYMIAGLHLLCKDRLFGAGTYSGPQFPEVKAITQATSRTNNGETNALLIRDAINRTHSDMQLAPW